MKTADCHANNVDQFRLGGDARAGALRAGAMPARETLCGREAWHGRKQGVPKCAKKELLRSLAAFGQLLLLVFGGVT